MGVDGGFGGGARLEEKGSGFIIRGHEEKQKIPSISTRRGVISHPKFSPSSRLLGQGHRAPLTSLPA